MSLIDTLDVRGFIFRANYEKKKIIKIRERIRRIIEEDDRSGYEQWRI